MLLLLLLMPWGPKRVEGLSDTSEDYMLKVPGEVTVTEGLCIHVPCEFSYPEEGLTDSDHVYGFWFREESSTGRESLVTTNNPKRRVQKATEGRFNLTGLPQDKNCSLVIRDARKKDKGSYFFRLERGRIKWSYKQNKLFVNVTALKPRIDIPETLVVGHPSNLTCSVPRTCELGTPPILSWIWASVSPQSPRTTHSSVLTLIPRAQDHGTNVTCLVTLPWANVTRRTTIHLNISYAPQNVTVTTWGGAGGASTVLENGSSLPIPEGQSLILLCVADSNPPARLSWSWGNLSLCPSQLSNPGLLELSPVHLKQGGEFTCQAQNALGSQHLSLTLPMQSSAALSGVMWGVFVGTGTTVLIFSSVCIILMAVRSWRRNSARPMAEVTDLNALRGSVSQSPLVESQADDSSPAQSPTVIATPSATEEEEVHYASLSFREMKPRDPQRQQNTTTEYSEIKINK